MRLIRSCMLVVLFAAVALTPVAAAEKENKFPDAVKIVLEKATEYEIYSVDPSREEKVDNGFHGWKVFGKTTVQGDKRKDVLAQLEKGLANPKGGAKCFIPRHGIRAVHEGKTIDLVICFQCSWIYVYVDNKEKTEVVLVTSSEAQDLLNKILTDAKVKLAPKEKD